MNQPEYRTVDPWDKAQGLANLPDALRTNQSTVKTETPLVGDVRTFVIETFRREGEDTIFLQIIDAQGGQRLVLPPRVAKVIASQRESLNARSRSRAAKATAAARKAAGIQPAFLKAGKKKAK